MMRFLEGIVLWNFAPMLKTTKQKKKWKLKVKIKSENDLDMRWIAFRPQNVALIRLTTVYLRKCRVLSTDEERTRTTDARAR